MARRRQMRRASLDTIWMGLAGLVLLLVLIGLGVPIAFAMGVVGVGGLIGMGGLQSAYEFARLLPYTAIANWGYVIVPLFVLMGYLTSASGVGSDAYSMAEAWLGGLPGGLAVATVAGGAAFGAACGSSMAAAVALARVAVPEMMSHGYDRAFSTGSVASAGVLAIMIPPSGMLALYGIMTDTSIGFLLLAGILPGIMIALLMGLTIILWVRLNPKIAPRKGKSPSLKAKLSSLRGSIGIIILVFIIVGGMYSGLATATEAAAWGTLAALIMLLVSKRREWLPSLRTGLRESAQTTSFVFALIFAGSFLALFLTKVGIGQSLESFLTGLSLSPHAILVLVLLPYIPLGMVMDPVSMLVVTLPFVFPIVTKLGFDPVWFGVIVTMLVEIANLTPPVGLNVYVVSGTTGVPLEDCFRGVTPFVICLLFALALLIIFPDIALLVPRMMRV